MSVGEAYPVDELEEERPESIKPRKALEDTEMDITPMIDITFLLLIFFIVASKMDETANVTLPTAVASDAIPTKQAVIITVGPGADDDSAAVYKGDSTDPANLFDSSDTDTLENEIEAYVEETTSLDPNIIYVVIKGEADVKHKHISTTAKAAARVAQITNMMWAIMEPQ